MWSVSRLIIIKSTRSEAEFFTQSSLHGAKRSSLHKVPYTERSEDKVPYTKRSGVLYTKFPTRSEAKIKIPTRSEAKFFTRSSLHEAKRSSLHKVPNTERSEVLLIMAAQNKLFQRLIWLVDTIYSAGHITREEIDRRWANSVYNDEHASRYGERNFHRHKDTIYEMFGIEIVCNRSTKEYSLASLGDMENGGIRSWLIDTFAINNIVNLAGDMKKRILFEPIPEGTRFLSPIVSAMREGRQLFVTYQRFEKPQPHSFLLAPYCLKVFKQRWYLVGKPEDHPEEDSPRIYALDRMKDICATEKPFHMPKDFNPSRFFAAQFGVDRSVTHAERVLIKVTAATSNYIRTLPIHGSQVELERNEQYSIFCFRIAPTYDFIQELRKHGATLEVLEPAYLREEFRQESTRLELLYNTEKKHP